MNTHAQFLKRDQNAKDSGKDNLICVLDMVTDCVSSEQTDKITLLTMDLHRIV